MDRDLISGLSGDVIGKMDEIFLIGGGGHAKVIISILKKFKDFRIKGYLDPQDNGELLGVPYLGIDSQISDLVLESNIRNAVLAVGQIGLGKARYDIWCRLRAQQQLSFPKIISPDAIVNEGVVIDHAVMVMDGAIINTGAKVGLGVIANTHCTIEHDVQLSDWVHVAPGATILGGVTVGRFSMIGAGSTVVEGTNIAAEIIVGAGATVIHDLVEPGVYVGTPARRLK
jgi:sugar O-acyltransferase (sialic acid O-acetyltransferase NeuD family)